MSKKSYFKEFRPALLTAMKSYSAKNFSDDVLAGLIVAIVALPLSMAFAIGSGASPEKGLYTAIIGGFLISLLGGSNFQIGGPAGAFVVLIYNIIQKHGFEGLLIGTFLAGLILLLMGLFKLGSVIKFIPYPVTKGFSAGIAVIILVGQLNDFFGMGIKKVPAEFFEKIVSYAENIGNISSMSLIVGILSILIIIYTKKFTSKIPGPFVAVVLSVIAIKIFNLPIETVQDRFGSIPNMLPHPVLPAITMEKIKLVLPDSITIAVLGAIESLMSAVVADGMTGKRHRSNMELIAQGIANMVSPLFSGIPATGTIARTATNIKNGGKSPISGMFHAVWVLLFMMLLSPLIVKIPFATLAAILIVVAYNMSELHLVKKLFKAPKSDIFVFLVTFLVTIIFDLNMAVQLGMLFAVLLFMRRMISLTEVKDSRLSLEGNYSEGGFEIEEIDDKDAIFKKVVPEGVEVYEINGPFFFGVADKVKSVLTSLDKYPKVFIIRMRNVPMIDATGMHALSEICEDFNKKGTKVILSGVSSYVKTLLFKNHVNNLVGDKNIVDHIDKALKLAESYLK